jgi:hypothetical protein
MQYDEQLGSNLQEFGKIGEIAILYIRTTWIIKSTINLLPKKIVLLMNFKITLNYPIHNEHSLFSISRKCCSISFWTTR